MGMGTGFVSVTKKSGRRRRTEPALARPAGNQRFVVTLEARETERRGGSGRGAEDSSLSPGRLHDLSNGSPDFPQRPRPYEPPQEIKQWDGSRSGKEHGWYSEMPSIAPTGAGLVVLSWSRCDYPTISVEVEELICCPISQVHLQPLAVNLQF